MEPLLITLTAINLIFFVIQFYLYKRSDNVAELRRKILELCAKYNEAKIRAVGLKYTSAYDWCYVLIPTFSEMLYSFKKLSVENYIPHNQLEELLSVGEHKEVIGI